MANKIGRNELCPCGSGNKYKNCFEKELETCSLFAEHMKEELLKNHQEKDDNVFRFFREILEDSGSVFVRNEEKQELVSSRVQMIIVFTLADIMASYWFAYEGRTGTPTQRFVEWINKYCYIENNKQYPDSVFSEVSPERLFELRNSLVHFFGLASGENQTNPFAISPNSDEWRPIYEKFLKHQKKRGINTAVIESKKFHNLILEGSTIMLDDWRENIDAAQSDEEKKIEHVNGIDRVYQKIQNEGAFKIELPREE